MPVEIQQGMAGATGRFPDRRIEFRDRDKAWRCHRRRRRHFGDGVNVAARLESIAEPGGIIISSSVRDQVGERLGLSFEDLGELRAEKYRSGRSCGFGRGWDDGQTGLQVVGHRQRIWPEPGS